MWVCQGNKLFWSRYNEKCHKSEPASKCLSIQLMHEMIWLAGILSFIDISYNIISFYLEGCEFSKPMSARSEETGSDISYTGKSEELPGVLERISIASASLIYFNWEGMRSIRKPIFDSMNSTTLDEGSIINLRYPIAIRYPAPKARAWPKMLGPGNTIEVMIKTARGLAHVGIMKLEDL